MDGLADLASALVALDSVKGVMVVLVTSDYPEPFEKGGGVARSTTGVREERSMQLSRYTTSLWNINTGSVGARKV